MKWLPVRDPILFLEFQKQFLLRQKALSSIELFFLVSLRSQGKFLNKCWNISKYRTDLVEMHRFCRPISENEEIACYSGQRYQNVAVEVWL